MTCDKETSAVKCVPCGEGSATMAYAATLLNRLTQFGRVSYDLDVTDDAALLPAQRSSVSWLVDVDAASSATALAVAVANATNSLRDAEIATNLLAAVATQGPVTFRYSTPTQNVQAVRALFPLLSQWDAVRLATYISSLGLTDAQYTAFFGYSGAGLVAFKAKLAQAVTVYNGVLAMQGA